jgi:hypothetical protein
MCKAKSMSRTKPILRMAFWGADKGLAAGEDEVVTISPLCRAWHGPINLLGQVLRRSGSNKCRNHVPHGFTLLLGQGQVTVDHFSVWQTHFDRACVHFKHIGFAGGTAKERKDYCTSKADAEQSHNLCRVRTALRPDS